MDEEILSQLPDWMRDGMFYGTIEDLKERLPLITRYSNELKKFYDFCMMVDKTRSEPDVIENWGEDGIFGQVQWYDMSLGFFAALGVEPNDCGDLSLLVRYYFQYWG